jgi:hypothetical protein
VPVGSSGAIITPIASLSGITGTTVCPKDYYCQVTMANKSARQVHCVRLYAHALHNGAHLSALNISNWGTGYPVVACPLQTTHASTIYTAVHNLHMYSCCAECVWFPFLLQQQVGVVTGSPIAGPGIPVRCPGDLGTAAPSAANTEEKNCRE